ncbi:MAG: ABC transporter ATP-binding protein [Thermodesulfobacteriota bacterium]
MLAIDQVKVSYGQSQVLHGVSLQVKAGQKVCLIGANGTGKSTLLRTISGLVRPQKGSIVFDGQNIEKWPVDKIVRSGLIQMPEGRDIFARMTVHQNLLMGAYCRKSRQHLRGDLQKVFSYFPILAKRIKQTAGTLSGGEQQMLAIGRALMARPRMLLLDEPSQGLAPLVIKSIFEILGAINQEGVPILVVEQNARIALEFSDYAYVIQTGKLVMEGPAEALLHDKSIIELYLS